MDKNTTMTTTPDEIETKLVEKEASIKREDELAPEALLCAKNGGKGGNGGNGSKAGKGGKSPRKDKRDNKDHRNEKDLRKCFHCQRQGYITEKCLSKQRDHPAKGCRHARKSINWSIRCLNAQHVDLELLDGS